MYHRKLVLLLLLLLLLHVLHTKTGTQAPLGAADGGSLCQLSSPDLEPPSVRCLDSPGTGFLRFVVMCTVRRVLFLMAPKVAKTKWRSIKTETSQYVCLFAASLLVQQTWLLQRRRCMCGRMCPVTTAFHLSPRQAHRIALCAQLPPPSNAASSPSFTDTHSSSSS